MYLHICTNERHKFCILSMQQSEMLLYALNLGFFILGFAIYTEAQGVCLTVARSPVASAYRLGLVERPSPLARRASVHDIQFLQ